MHKAYARTQDRGRLVFALALGAIVVGGWSTGAQREPRTLLRLPSQPMAFALADSRFAWVGDRVTVADLASGKRIKLVRSGNENETVAAVAGSTVMWLQVTGGNSVIDTLRAAAPGRQKRFGQWGDDNYYLDYGPVFGGFAADGNVLVYAVYELTSDQRQTDDCYEKGICTWTVTGGATYLVRPGSLSRSRILGPATAVAVDRGTVAAATLQVGTHYKKRRAQIVLLNLRDSSQHSLGTPADVAKLLLHKDRLAVVSVNSFGAASVSIWNVKTLQLVRTLELPSGTKLQYFAWASGRLLLRGRSRGSAAIMAIDLRTGRSKVLAPIRSNFDYGPWAWRGRAVWVEQYGGGKTLVKSARL